MLNFTIHTTTEIVFGRGIEEQIGPKLKEIGAHRVLIHFGGSSARSSGLLDRVEQSLFHAGLSFIEFGGVEPNPKVSMVRKGIALCQREGIDFILAVWRRLGHRLGQGYRHGRRHGPRPRGNLPRPAPRPTRPCPSPPC